MSLRSSDLLLDARNVELLRLLCADPRMAISALARKVGMSAPATRERIRRLEEAQLIKGYRLDLDPRALGFPVAAFVRVRPMPGKLPKISELAQRMPQVTECHRVTGEDSHVVRAAVRSVEHSSPRIPKRSSITRRCAGCSSESSCSSRVTVRRCSTPLW